MVPLRDPGETDGRRSDTRRPEFLYITTLLLEDLVTDTASCYPRVQEVEASMKKYDRSWKRRANQRDLGGAVQRAMKALKGSESITRESVAQRVKSYGVASLSEATRYLELHGLPKDEEEKKPASQTFRPDRLVTHGPSFRGR